MANAEKTWSEVLEEIRAGERKLPTVAAPISTLDAAIPAVADKASLYELFQILGAVTKGYNTLVGKVLRKDKKLDMLRRLVNAYVGVNTSADKEQVFLSSDGWIYTKDSQPNKSGHYMCWVRPEGGSRGWIYPYEYSKRHNAWNATDRDNGNQYAVDGVYAWYPNPMLPNVPDGPESEED